MLTLEDFDFVLVLADGIAAQESSDIMAYLKKLKVSVTSLPSSKSKFLLKLPDEGLL
jgi:hypothetical protein